MGSKPKRRTPPKKDKGYRWSVVRWDLPPAGDSHVWAEVESGDPKWAGYLFRVTFFNGVLSGLEIQREEDAPPLTARRMQEVPVGALEQCARARIQPWLRGYSQGRPVAAKDASSALEDLLEGMDQPNPAAVTRSQRRQLMLAQLAVRYAETLGDPEQVEILADEFNFEDSHIPNLIGEARRLEILSPTIQGRAGGAPTEKAIRILSGDPQPDVEGPGDTRTEHPRMAEAIEANQRMKEALEAGDMDEWNRLAEEAIKEAGHG